MADDIAIRRADRDDAPAITAANIAMARETEGRTLDPAVALAGVLAVLDDPDRGFYLLARRHTRIVGQLMVTREWSDWRNAFFWWIQSVYVAPDARRSGVYTALYRSLVAEARAAGNVCGLRLYVEKENHPAQAVYRALGMTPARYDVYESDLTDPD